ncbi:MATE family efflux transporter, partial [Pseudomonas syringae group genomosp. 7]|uniref:MATE family efflux transporter n=1 Tax=Pseudomonas syringae group genomosp. 7 TaxID=251699 RepID=UPI00376FB61E
VFAAQAAGRNDSAELRRILLQGLLLGVGMALVLGVFALPFSHLALEMMQPSAGLRQMRLDFFLARLVGLPAALARYAVVGG